MKRVLYCSIRDRYIRGKSFGVVNKIDAQKKCFENAGCKVFLRSPKGGNIVLPGNRRISNGKWDKISLPKQIDLMYLRFDAADRSFVRLLRKYKQENPKGKALLEFPTYPFKKEYVQSAGWLFYLQSMYSLYRARRYLDGIVMIANPIKTMWGKPVICIKNGVDYERINVRTPKSDSIGIHIICVASFALWHGYDRLLNGLKNYVDRPGCEKVVLHMVGSLKNIHSLGLDDFVKKNHLEQNVIFYDTLAGEKLDAVYDRCDLACNSFGMHRIGFSVSSSLKAREYAAKGLPMLVSSELDVEKADTRQYICHFPSDESPIDFEKLVQFYHRVYDGKDKQSVADDIRSRFEKYCSMDECFKDVVQYVIDGKS